MSIEGEVDSIVRAIAEAPTNLTELEGMLPESASLDDAATLSSVPNNYRPGCKEHCALWQQCRGQALETRAPVVLGDHAAEALAAAGSIDRALDLMMGAGAPPRNPAEAALARELQAANLEFRRAVGHD
jgi:hypothetical protein